VVGKDTHLTRGGGDVDLGTVIANLSVSGVGRSGATGGMAHTRQWSGRWSDRDKRVSSGIRQEGRGRWGWSTHLVRQSQGQLDLVGNGLSVPTALDGSAEHGGTGPQGRASEAEGAHGAMDGSGGEKAGGWIPLNGRRKGRSRAAGCSLARHVMERALYVPGREQTEKVSMNRRKR
jgi:hypothetical protein